jgi:hypothetical protein
MPVSDFHRFLYVHIPRTGGTSITLSLQRCGVELKLCGRATAKDRERFGQAQIWLHHLPAHLLLPHLPREDWHSFLKFAFVRNPWDWVVSTYFYHRQQMKSERFRAEWPQIVSSLEGHVSFEEWVLRGMYMQDQASFVVDRHGHVLLDQICRFEFLQEKFSSICQTLDLHCSLPKTNESEHNYYRDYYSNQMRREVARRFGRDITMFNYEF